MTPENKKIYKRAIMGMALYWFLMMMGIVIVMASIQSLDAVQVLNNAGWIVLGVVLIAFGYWRYSDVVDNTQPAPKSEKDS
jgi:purine-cytosine permease-like protein